MSTPLFKECVSWLLSPAIEGGYQANPDDTGNWTSGQKGLGELRGTKYGISAASFPDVDIKNLSPIKAADLYEEHYWKPYGLDLLPPGLALAVFDAAVNQGQNRAVRWLQRVLGVNADNVVGPDTARAAAQNPKKTLREYLRLRMMNYVMNDRFKIFGADWVDRLLLCHEKALELQEG